jgi:hypothetical protein
MFQARKEDSLELKNTVSFRQGCMKSPADSC